ncbi:MAG: ribonuclease H family protein [Saprospiraceae bacterium]|jgi:ribonuclease HI|nr:ribonuclease H family protein [Saprospiraceae bacterium]
MAKKQKYYVVWEGFTPGIYMTWDECKTQITGHPSAKYKAFENRAEAEFAQKRNYFEFVNKAALPKKESGMKQSRSAIIADSISVDAACSGNPGLMEYRGVETQSGKQLFHQGPFKNGTNNIGEFLGLVHGLAMLKKLKNDHTTIYSDSLIAIKWVKIKKAKTKLEVTDDNKILFELIERAENWLKENTYSNPIIKWDTVSWGEIPADFGRK